MVRSFDRNAAGSQRSPKPDGQAPRRFKGDARGAVARGAQARTRALDTVHPIETPEGVELELHVAGPLPRALAWGIDFAVRLAIVLVLWIPLAVLQSLGTGVLLLLVFLLEWLYPVLFEVLSSGSTPGKRVLGLRVVHADGTPVDWHASTLRNLLRAADFLPLVYVFGGIAIVCNASFQRLGDLAAGTLVIHSQTPARVPALHGVTPVAPRLPLDMQEQQAILSLALRSPRLPKARVQELAELALPALTPDQLPEGEQAVTRVQAAAAWLLGRRTPT